MKCYVYDWASDELLRTVEGTPECARDFCDHCGDCLDCFNEDPCPDGRGTHSWVCYEGEGAVGPLPPDRRTTAKDHAGALEEDV